MKFKLSESKTLNEKWYNTEDNRKIWWSDSAIQFKNFLVDLAQSGSSQGYRLVIGPDTYAIADAKTGIHNEMYRTMEKELYVPSGMEYYILGIPTIEDFNKNNFENSDTSSDTVICFNGFEAISLENLSKAKVKKTELYKALKSLYIGVK